YHRPFLTGGINTIQLHPFPENSHPFEISLSSEVHVIYRRCHIHQVFFHHSIPQWLYLTQQYHSLLTSPGNTCIWLLYQLLLSSQFSPCAHFSSINYCYF